MAASSNSNYLPPLDKCLSGGAHLISWKSAYRALCDEQSVVESSPLALFFSDPEVHSIIESAPEPFQAPSQHSARDFETRTAPIHLTPSDNAEVKVHELKADAKWLSQQVQISEVVALRIAVLEWEERASQQLLSNASNDPTDSTSQDGVKHVHFLDSTIQTRESTTNLSPLAASSPEEKRRRERIIDIFVEERLHVVRLKADLLARDALDLQDNQWRPRTWIDETATRIEAAIGKTPLNVENLCLQCIHRIGSVLEQAEDRSLWPAAFVEDGMEERYTNYQYFELIGILRLLAIALYKLQDVPSSPLATAWFSLMDKCLFLEEIKPLFAATDMSLPQSLAAVASLQILKTRVALSQSAVETLTSRGSLSGSSYIDNEECLFLLNSILYKAATSSLATASPVVLAWTRVAMTIKEIALAHRQSRESLLDSSEDGSLSTGRNNRERHTDFERFHDSLLSSDGNDGLGDLPIFFAEMAIDHMGSLGFIANLANFITSTFRADVEAPFAAICKETLLDTLCHSLEFVQYGSEIVEAFLAVLSPNEGGGLIRRYSENLATRLLDPGNIMRYILLDQAIARYPCELSPVVRLLTLATNTSYQSDRSGHSASVVELLDSLTSLTLMIPDTFRSYQLENEDTNANALVLTSPLAIFVPKQDLLYLNPNFVPQRSLNRTSSDLRITSGLIIEAGSSGIALRESRPLIIKLNHAHSGLQYLGLLLSTLVATSELASAAPGSALDRPAAAEIVDLLTNLLLSAMKQDHGQSAAESVLGRFSSALPNEQDVVLVISELFETELLSQRDQTVHDGSLELLTACVKFFDVLTTLQPDRVWSVFGRSSLLGIDNAPTLPSVVAGCEINLGRFGFLKACITLYASLLSNTVSGLVERKREEPKMSSRFLPSPPTGIGASDRTITGVAVAWQKLLIDVVHELPGWRFDDMNEKCEILHNIFRAFTDLLQYTYGVGNVRNHLANVLIPAANLVLEACAPTAGASSVIGVVRRVLQETLPIASDLISVETRNKLTCQANAALCYVSTLMRVVRCSGQRTTTDQAGFLFTTGRTAALASSVLGLIPTLSSLIASSHQVKVEIFPLLAELVASLAANGSDPPSILQELNTSTAKLFLIVASQPPQPLSDVLVETEAWNFLTALMSSRQQWSAIFLLTGSFPKDRTRKVAAKSRQSSKPILQRALDQLSEISMLPPERAAGMLKFVAQAQQAWAWTTNELRNHPLFMKKILAWLRDLQAPSSNPSSAEALISAREFDMATHICDILAVYLQRSLEIGDHLVLNLMVPEIGFLRDHAVRVDAYNRSLHRRLADNLKQKFSHCELADFMRSQATSRSIGSEYLFDLAFAGKVLGYDASWKGAKPSLAQGFSDELIRVNVNLSLVHAQKRLLVSWKALATTLGDCADRDEALQVELAKAVRSCLSCNTHSSFDQPDIAEILEERADMAFVLAARLVSLKVDNAEMKALLPAAWDLVSSSPVDYEVASAPEDIVYYRKVLQILYLAIQPHCAGNAGLRSQSTEQKQIVHLDPDIAACLVQIIGKVVAPALRALFSNLHNRIEMALPADFALLTAIFNAVLEVPGINSTYTSIADIVNSSSLIRGSLSLYSWSDQLAEGTSQDPVYGEIAIRLLLTFSTIPPVAEQIALNGTLGMLASANLSDLYRKPNGKGPFDAPKRMFSVWSDGFLPICLNLLDAIGAPIASEVAEFLNSFPAQLRRAEKSLQSNGAAPDPHPGAVTLGLVHEASNLCTIALILQSDRARGAADGIDAADLPPLDFDVSVVQALVESLVRSRRSLRDRILAVNELEARWHRMPVSGSSDNLLAEKITSAIVSLLGCLGNADV